jgi:hypothetical protein
MINGDLMAYFTLVTCLLPLVWLILELPCFNLMNLALMLKLNYYSLDAKILKIRIYS